MYQKLKYLKNRNKDMGAKPKTSKIGLRARALIRSIIVRKKIHLTAWLYRNSMHSVI